MRLSFMKLPAIRQFDLMPRYYDPEKEKLAEIVANAKREMGLAEGETLDIEDKKGYAANIRGQFSRSRKQNHLDVARAGRKKSNIRILVIVAILLILFYIGYAKSMELAMLIVK